LPSLAVEQRHVDRLALAGFRLMDDRGQNGDCGIEPADQIAHRHANLHRFGAGHAVPLAGDAHQAAHALDHIVITGLVLVRPVMTEARQRAIDKSRVLAGQAVIVEPIPGERAGFKILHHDMGTPRQAFHQGSAFRLGEIDGDGLLVAVGGEEVGRVALSPVRCRNEWRTEVAGLVALAGLFDLDDLRAEIAENLGRPGGRQHAAQVEHAKM
jgi:hypothetical protein